MFTQEQVLEMQQKLALLGVKDTQLPVSDEPLTGDEIVTFVQDGENIKIKLSALAAYLYDAREAERDANEEQRIINEEGRINNEDLRIDSENARNTAENTREINESTRQSNETIRINNELQRTTNEDRRANSELTRVESETERLSSETARKNSEVDRIQKENDRVTKENDRVVAETNRQSNEQQRINNENPRISAELARESSEGTRKSNEQNRVLGETTRQSAETSRQSNETARSNAEATRVGNENSRISAENTRGTNETTRQSNESTRQSNETTRQANESTRQSNETSRINAENLRNTAESARESNTATAISNANAASTAANTAANNANNAVSGIDNRLYKTLNIGTSGLVTLSPTTSYFTYRLNVTDNVILNIDLQRMINQIGNARCRLIVDMPIVKTITLTKPLLWGGTVQTFASAGQYIFEIIDVDGTGTPLIWQVASTTKVQPTGVILYVDSTSADYSTAQINGETATRTTSTWASPFKYLQNAINAANAGDMIFVKSGTYYPTHLRTTPTSYADGDYQRRDATFTMKTGVDVYGGFLGTESKTWQRVVDSKGFPVNKSILNGDIKREAVIDAAKTVGDLRTDASKANAAYNVVYANVASYTYLNGFDVKYGNANGSSAPTDRGGGISNANLNLVSISCTAYNNSANYGGGWSFGTNTNCTAYNNSTTNYGGGWIYGTNTNCTAYNNSATSGGGWIYGTNTNCTAYNNSATSGGGWIYGTNTNCNCINNKGNSCIYIGTDLDITNINCLLIDNKTTSNGIAPIYDGTSSKIYIFRNNVYDCPNPILSGGEGSDIDFTTCKPNVTLTDVKIDVPSFVGLAANDTQLQELKDFATNIITHLKPKAGSILKGAGINNTTYSNPNDFAGIVRPANCTVGILEG